MRAQRLAKGQAAELVGLIMRGIINISWRRVGGLRFLKIGRFTFMFCISAEYRPL